MGKLNQLNTALHLIAGGFLTCTIVLDFFFGTEEFLAEDPNYMQFAKPYAGVITFATGLLSVNLLKPSEEAAKSSDVGKDGNIGVETLEP